MCNGGIEEVASLGVDDALGLACAAGGVQHEEHVLTGHGLRRTQCGLPRHCLEGGGESNDTLLTTRTLNVKL